MAYEAELKSIESEWDLDQGFFWQIREGHFEEREFKRALRKIKSVRFARSAVVLPRRIVSLLWYIPLFMEWQKERIAENGGDAAAYKRAVNLMTNEIERLLGVP